MKSEANERQVAGEHYKSKFQHWDWADFISLGYLPAQVTKYLIRWQKKNGLQDLEKADHFLEKYIQMEEHRQTANRVFTTNFLREHPELGMEEQSAVHLIVEHTAGDLEKLQIARRCVQRLVATEKHRIESSSWTMPAQECPSVFVDERDAPNYGKSQEG